MSDMKILKDRVIVEQIAPNKWKTLEEISINVHDIEIVVPKGFRTDFASVPRCLWSIFPPYGKHTVAAIVHDFLYATHLTTREKADLIFLELMKVYNVNPVKRKLMYLAVKYFGEPAYKQYKKTAHLKRYMYGY